MLILKNPVFFNAELKIPDQHTIFMFHEHICFKKLRNNHILHEPVSHRL